MNVVAPACLESRERLGVVSSDHASKRNWSVMIRRILGDESWLLGWEEFSGCILVAVAQLAAVSR